MATNEGSSPYETSCMPTQKAEIHIKVTLSCHRQYKSYLSYARWKGCFRSESLTFSYHWFYFLAETSSGLKNRERVDLILNRSLDALRDYIKCSYPDKPSRFAHILLRLPTLRAVCSKMANECLFAKSFLSLAVPQVLSFMMEVKTHT